MVAHKLVIVPTADYHLRNAPDCNSKIDLSIHHLNKQRMFAYQLSESELQLNAHCLGPTFCVVTTITSIRLTGYRRLVYRMVWALNKLHGTRRDCELTRCKSLLYLMPASDRRQFVTSRCLGQPISLQCPTFVQTLNSFYFLRFRPSDRQWIDSYVSVPLEFDLPSPLIPNVHANSFTRRQNLWAWSI